MGKENQMIITGKNKFNTVLFFRVIEVEDEYEYGIKVGCSEDMEMYMKVYVQKDWEELFRDTSVDSRRVCDVGFSSLLVEAVDEIGEVRYEMDRTERLAVTFKSSVLKDHNETKIKMIREIIG